MKIIKKLRQAEAEGRTTWSFEFFPPKTQAGVLNLYDRLERMYSLGPSFIDVTWGAGGSTADLTLEICNVAQSVWGLETCMHLTCTNMPRAKIDDALTRAREIGIQNILALRGDPPRGQEHWTACDGGFNHAIDLVRYIREKHGDWFCIAVAGYPEGHTENTDVAADLRFLKDKVDAGADFVVTQLFYDVDLFVGWVKACRAAGINCPILPGIMPIQTFGGFVRMTSLSQTRVPQHVFNALEPIKDDDQAVKDYGVQLAIDMCKKLIDNDIRAFHIYTMNLERSVRLILEGLDFVPALETARPLPWNPSLSAKRLGENVRPVFWRHRTLSYVNRTETWDDFPNGRWGDARSPAFGELDGYGVSLKLSRAESLKTWGRPTTLRHVYRVFADYCRGKIKALPWCDQPLAGESKLICDALGAANLRGFLTINSQPPVNGAKSSDPTVGWGPKGGYVYQKAYLEFFVSPAKLDALVALLRDTDPDSLITYHAVNRAGDDVRTNHAGDSPNAVTWGVFPGKEIVQPTIVDLASFMAWKDEAFALWDQWTNLYENDTQEHALLKALAGEWFLINIVHNDFTEDKGALFALLKRVAAAVDGIPVDATNEELLEASSSS
ncbi:methylenetetrahydrofolate reductase (NAD(P)H) met13 [Blastocladiella emersonii ATCC 22665]|nr:methylenetetrahydrofolate reductase (NAD(P)H) met13 [Blastocladiella emersonii ATCC 22665]